MWYKLTSTVRRQKHDSKSLYYFQFFVPEEDLSFNPKYQENFLKYIFYIFYFTVLTIFQLVPARRSARSPHVFPTHNLTRSPPFELRALLSERLEQANHILFTSLSLCHQTHQDQSAVCNFYHVKCMNLNSDVIA